MSAAHGSYTLEAVNSSLACQGACSEVLWLGGTRQKDSDSACPRAQAVDLGILSGNTGEILGGNIAGRYGAEARGPEKQGGGGAEACCCFRKPVPARKVQSFSQEANGNSVSQYTSRLASVCKGIGNSLHFHICKQHSSEQVLCLRCPTCRMFVHTRSYWNYTCVLRSDWRVPVRPASHDIFHQMKSNPLEHSRRLPKATASFVKSSPCCTLGAVLRTVSLESRERSWLSLLSCVMFRQEGSWRLVLEAIACVDKQSWCLVSYTCEVGSQDPDLTEPCKALRPLCARCSFKECYRPLNATLTCWILPIGSEGNTPCGYPQAHVGTSPMSARLHAFGRLACVWVDMNVAW